jgi:hypothetical protein
MCFSSKNCNQKFLIVFFFFITNKCNKFLTEFDRLKVKTKDRLNRKILCKIRRNLFLKKIEIE